MCRVTKAIWLHLIHVILPLKPHGNFGTKTGSANPNPIGIDFRMGSQGH